MASPTPLIEPTDSTILFRPSKKRKIYRQRANTDDEPALPAAIPAPEAQSIDELIASSSTLSHNDTQEMEATEVSMAEILRLRNLKKKRVGGVAFRAAEAVRGDADHGALVLHDGDGTAEESEVDEVARRFAPQTGFGGGGGMDVDRHMMAYIDSELAKRRAAEAHTQNQQEKQQQQQISRSGAFSATQTRRVDHEGKKAEAQRQPATLGKLQEIDLGDEARDRNVAQTERARRRLDGEQVEEEGETKPVKVRLGPDGKPWRGRKRRGSDDIKRDRLVEDVLRENRLEIYDELPVESTTINDDQAADDRIAEAFRREFMDAVSQRQRKKTAPAQAPLRGPGGKKVEEELKGPKLGGSRSARAAHMEMLKQQQASGKK
ncbi:hypothetical protein D0Z07_2743 [Hyphodiscus hymeniophilus]|uniref:Uncharacterized protein n=1 Tax=Hyphodiscus hymeniophilus TaxID=353542 RepID=A0A9P6VMM7_9HELO|nr:hypothetical protein D0Z07_2743 [Hyphodiscus hymeniophilus]